MLQQSAAFLVTLCIINLLLQSAATNVTDAGRSRLSVPLVQARHPFGEFPPEVTPRAAQTSRDAACQDRSELAVEFAGT